jgi:hypothetical protein
MLKLCEALGITPGQFFAPPDWPSLDSLVKDQEKAAIMQLAAMIESYLKHTR